MFFRELMHMCSKENTTSRGFYIAVTIGLLVLLLGGIVCLITSVLGFTQGQTTKAIISLIIAVFVFAVDCGICFVLNRS